MAAMPEPFRLPGADNKTIVIGANGSGKTIFGAWLLSKQRFDKRPWVILDFKNEELWDQVGYPPIKRLRLGEMPAKKQLGLFIMTVLPGQEDLLEEWLWKVFRREDIGLFCDEVTLIQNSKAFLAILRMGRSKRIPLIACTQRPVKVERELFTESQFKVIFRLDDARDYKTVEEFTGDADLSKPLPEHWCYWYDSPKRSLHVLKPCPPPDTVAKSLRRAAPYTWFFGG
jgi:hypothetical protein